MRDVGKKEHRALEKNATKREKKSNKETNQKGDEQLERGLEIPHVSYIYSDIERHRRGVA